MAQHVNLLFLLLFGVASAVIFYYLYFIVEDIVSKGSSNYINWITIMLDRMFIRISRGKAIAIVIGSTLLCGSIGLYLTFEYGIFNIIFTISSMFAGWNLPRFYLNFTYKKRLDKIDNQLIDALTMMSNSLKSNLNLNQVIGVVVQEMSAPISQEFGLVLNQHQLGLTIDEALTKLMERVPTEDMTLVINSILILREKGGDISETFDIISGTIRERKKVEAKIQALTAQGRMQSFILFIIPFAIGLVMYYFNPENIRLLFTTGTGRIIVLVMLILQLIGGVWFKKIVDIKV
jgi:tight adherence protein B